MPESSRPPEMFPERLRKARELRGYNQAELAKQAKLQVSAISHFETGTRKPSFDNLRRLADALQVTTDYLLGRVDNIASHAGADLLHRHFERMTAGDRKVAEEILKLFSEKTKTRGTKGD